MQLQVARLCLDCDEVHDAQECPVCASESFAYLSRWVPTPEPRPEQPEKPASSPQAEIYRQLIDNQSPPPSRARRLFKQGLVGLTAMGLAGFFWRSSAQAREAKVGPTSRSRRAAR